MGGSPEAPPGLATEGADEGSAAPTLPEVIDRLGVGLAQLRAGLCGGGVYVGDGAELLLISSVVQSVASEWDLGPMVRGLMVTIVFVGILVGNLVSGPVGDSFGHRQVILCSYAGLFCSSVLSAWSTGAVQLAVVRFCVGASFGVGQPAWTALGSEITPSYWRIAMNSWAQMLFVMGEIYSACLIRWDDPYMKSLHWRWLLRMGAIPSALFFVQSWFFLHPSPYYLAAKGRYDEAKAVLRSMACDNSAAPDASVDFAPVQTTAWASAREVVRRQIQIVFGRELLLTTAVVMYTCFIGNLIFYGCLFAFPQILPTFHSDSSPATELLVGALWELPGIVLGTIVGFCFYRKKALKLYLRLTAVSIIMFTFGALLSTQLNSPAVRIRVRHPWLPLMLRTVGFYGIKCFTMIGFVVFYQYSTEVYPNQARITGTAVNIGGGRLAGMLAPLAYEGLLDVTGGYATFFFIMAFLAIVNSFLIDALPYETFGMQLKDLGDIDGAGATAPLGPQAGHGKLQYGSDGARQEGEVRGMGP